MAIFKNFYATFFILTLLVSCGGEKTDNNAPNKQETPKALQDDKLEIKSYSRSGDLTEELYQELLDKSPTLKKLKDDLDALDPKSDNITDKFNKYDSKSKSYYNSTNLKTKTITDSLLRMRIAALISTSNNQYSNKTSELNSLLKQIYKNSTTLNDQYSVLKIVLTLPLIEKYQDDNLPDKKEFKELINEQNKLMFRTDSLTPKF